MKVVINTCFGGFSISLAAAKYMAERGDKRAQAEVAEHEATLVAFEHYKRTGKTLEGRYDNEAAFFDIDIKYGGQPKFHGYGCVEGFEGYGYERHGSALVAAVEALGVKANGEYAELRVVEIPDGTDYEIAEYDGNEHIAEKHRVWS